MDRIDYGRLIRVRQIVFQWPQHCPRNIQQITIHMEITHITTIIISSTINTMSQRLQMVSYRLIFCISFCFFFLKYFLNVCNTTVNIVSVFEAMWFLAIKRCHPICTAHGILTNENLQLNWIQIWFQIQCQYSMKHANRSQLWIIFIQSAIIWNRF